MGRSWTIESCDQGHLWDWSVNGIIQMTERVISSRRSFMTVDVLHQSRSSVIHDCFIARIQTQVIHDRGRSPSIASYLVIRDCSLHRSFSNTVQSLSFFEDVAVDDRQSRLELAIFDCSFTRGDEWNGIAITFRGNVRNNCKFFCNRHFRVPMAYISQVISRKSWERAQFSLMRFNQFHYFLWLSIIKYWSWTLCPTNDWKLLFLWFCIFKNNKRSVINNN